MSKQNKLHLHRWLSLLCVYAGLLLLAPLIRAQEKQEEQKQDITVTNFYQDVKDLTAMGKNAVLDQNGHYPDGSGNDQSDATCYTWDGLGQ